MGILDDMRGSEGAYRTGKFSMDDFRAMMDKLYESKPPAKGVTIYTGIGGMYTFDYAIAKETGFIAPHMEKSHAKLLRMDGYRRAVDVNGIRWMYDWVKGKLYWSNMHQLCPKQRRPMPTRFIDWEAGIGLEHKVRLTDEQRQHFLDRRKVKRDSAFRKEWMKEHEHRMYY